MGPSVKPGDRIRLLAAMKDDPDPIPEGSTGTVLAVTEGLMAQVTVHWDCQRHLSLLPGVDSWEVIGHSDLVADCMGCPKCGNVAMDLLEWDVTCTTVTCALCQCTYEP